LFTVGGLIDLLRQVGFADTRLRPQFHVWKDLACASERISKGALPSDSSIPISPLRFGLKDRFRARLNPHRAEFITLSCVRPC
jgi:hypothetical protein